MGSISLYEFGDIKTKVRRLTGHLDEEDLTDSSLSDYINRYYQLIFPLDVRPYELRTWFQFDLVVDTDTYDLTSGTYVDSVTSDQFDEYFITLEKPCTIDGYPLNLYLNAEDFYYKWPDIVTYSSGRPEDVLFYPQQSGTSYVKSLLFRYPPDDTYTVKFASLRKPQALSGSNIPIVEEWGPLIAYGAAKEVAEDYGDIETLQKIEPMYQKHKGFLMSKVHYQNVNQRAMPRW